MDRRELLEELLLALEGAVDQVGRAQRLLVHSSTQLGDAQARVDRLFAELAALRNEMRETLMKELAGRPKKLPVV